MSGGLAPVGASSGSSLAAAPSQQQQEITAAAAQLSDAIREIIRNEARSESDEIRGWLMLVATLTASITYSAALNPPGGVWQADDPAKGYIAGRPVLLDKFRTQYLAFCYCNATSFVASLSIIALGAYPSFCNKIGRSIPAQLVGLDILSLGGAFLAGSYTTPKRLIYNIAMMGAVQVYFVMCLILWFLNLKTPRRVGTP